MGSPCQEPGRDGTGRYAVRRRGRPARTSPGSDHDPGTTPLPSLTRSIRPVDREAHQGATEGVSMSTTLTVDLFVSVDGFAGSDGLPGYFGYLGSDLEEWITTEQAAPHVALMGRKTYEM